MYPLKPQRTASGVATVTVITKPGRCSGDCLFCPSDVRMPKSYLSNEPACQRAERNYFDPYLQVTMRLRALHQMGHVTDKVELIVLGGTWSDYPPEYQIWFIAELFRALNDGDTNEQAVQERLTFYERAGLSNCEEKLADLVSDVQQQVNGGALAYNEAMRQLYEESSVWREIATEQTASLAELFEQHRRNEAAAHRAVGLCVEVRPDTITSEGLTFLRRLGCTKIQMGIQSLDADVLAVNGRALTLETIQRAFALLRVFGFKIHVHFMQNLPGSSAADDMRAYRRLVTEAPYLPDEVKLYPCVLVENARLYQAYTEGAWQPYSEEELLEVLIADTLATPPFVRISRMIRDISARDIVAGNKKANLRQFVEAAIETTGGRVHEIRSREIRTSEIEVESLALDIMSYETTMSTEYFLQWVTPDDRIAGFLRLSLPDTDDVCVGDTCAPNGCERSTELPVAPGVAMIREVHVYGRVARLRETRENAQHLGLGRQLIEKACEIAREHGYHTMRVISAVGTRAYYRSLGFYDGELYQMKPLSLATGKNGMIVP